MKTAIFSSILIAGFLISPAAQAAPTLLEASGINSGVGISDKGSAPYRSLSASVFGEFQKNRATFLVLNRGELPSQKMQDDFSEYCLDQDYSDIVSWNALNGRDVNVSFSCVLASEQPKIQERLFVFSFRDQKLVDVRVASADIAPKAPRGKSKSSAPLFLDAESEGLSGAEKVVVAVSGAMLSSGVTAVTGKTAKDVPVLSSTTAKAAGIGGLAAGVSAAVNHFIFDMASSSKSGLSGGALTIALSEPELSNPGAIPQAFGDQSWLQNERRKAQSSSSGLNSVSVNLTFKFW